MSRSNNKEVPFVATATMIAMLSGFLLILLIPYNQLFAWSVFLTIEGVISGLIAKRLLEVKRKIIVTASKRSA